MLVTAKNASQLYWGTFIFALSNGTVESYINAAVAAMYPREKPNGLTSSMPAGPAASHSPASSASA